MILQECVQTGFDSIWFDYHGLYESDSWQSLFYLSRVPVFQPKFARQADAFVTKLDPLAPMYIQAISRDEYGHWLRYAVDTDGMLRRGQTCSLDFPPANPEQNVSGGNCDAFRVQGEDTQRHSSESCRLVFLSSELWTTSQSQVYYG